VKGVGVYEVLGIRQINSCRKDDRKGNFMKKYVDVLIWICPYMYLFSVATIFYLPPPPPPHWSSCKSAIRVRGGMDPKLTGPNLSEKPLPATQQD
jgi:hypothetical protein